MFIDPVTWGSKYFYFDPNASAKGLFNPRVCKFLIAPMLAFADPRIREGVEMGATQCGKTTKIILCAFWSLDQDPSSLMWVTPSEKFSKNFYKTRIKPCLDLCEPLQRRLPSARNAITTLEIDFPTGMFVLANAGSISEISGKPIRTLIIDEEKDYLPGRVEYALARTRSKADLKIWRMSTPKRFGDTIHVAFMGGTQDCWHVRCPRCEQLHQHKFKNVRYLATGLTLNEWWYECPVPLSVDSTGKPVLCGHRWFDEPADRMQLIDNGDYVSHNPGGPYPSWTYNAFLPPWTTWEQLLSDWLKAQAARHNGDYEPLKRFLNDVAVEPWEEQPADKNPEVVKFPYLLSTYHRKPDRYPGEVMRGLTVDVQLKDFRAIVRGWQIDAASKLLFAGTAASFDDLRALQEQFGIEDRFVFIDSAHQQEMVYAACATWNWFAVEGSEEYNFSHIKRDLYGRQIGHVLKPFSAIRPTWSYRKAKDCQFFRLATYRLKDITAFFRDGKAGVSWEIGTDTPDDYIRQVYSQFKIEKVNDRTKRLELVWPDRREDHFWDCEYMMTAMAIISGIIKLG